MTGISITAFRGEWGMKWNSEYNSSDFGGLGKVGKNLLVFLSLRGSSTHIGMYKTGVTFLSLLKMFRCCDKSQITMNNLFLQPGYS